MNKNCKTCEHHYWKPARDQFDMGFHMCRKYEDVLSEIRICERRNQARSKRENKA